jgi:hypothetical protein
VKKGDRLLYCATRDRGSPATLRGSRCAIKQPVPFFALLAGLLAAAACKPDLDVPRAYACASDTDCVGAGWVCGVEGFCVLPSVPSPRACHDDSLCAVDAGWRCGLDERCYDRLDAGAIACRRDAGVIGTQGGDCAPGWVCGLEGDCHAQSDVQAWSCSADSDCSGGWRCASTGACVDAAGDGLTTPAHDLVAAQKLNPIALSGMDPAHFSACREDFDFSSLMFAKAANNQVSVGYLAARSPVAFTSRTGSVTLAADDQVAISGLSMQAGTAALFVGGPTTGLRSFNVSTTAIASSASVLVAPPQSVDRFAVGVSGYGAALVDGGAFAVYFPGRTLPVEALPPPPAPGPINDVQAILDDNLTNGVRVFVAAGGGIFTSPPDPSVNPSANPNWSAVGDSSMSCGCGGCMFGASRVMTSIRYEGGALAYLGSKFQQVGPMELETDYIGFIDRSMGDTGAGGDPVCNGQAPALQCDTRCPPGELFEDYGPAALSPQPPALWVQCQNEFHAHVRYLLTATPNGQLGDCTRAPIHGGSTFVTNDPASGLVGPVPPMTDEDFVRAGTSGRAWVGPRFTAEHPIFLDRAPAAAFNVPDAGVLFAAGPWAAVATAQGGLTTFQAPWGTTASGVDGLAHWVVTEQGTVLELAPRPDGGFAAPIAVLAVETPSVQPPVNALLVPEADGGAQLVVTSNDTLYAAPRPQPGQPTMLPERVVVLAGNPIIAVAPTAPRAEGASLYALTPGGLFEVDATGDTRWRATEVVVPPLDYVRVFTEGPQTRLGARDGTVYALPSRVLLTGPLPDDREALDYAQICGTVFALTAGLGVEGLALYRIEPGVGWVPQVPLDGDFSGTDGAKLLVVGHRLFAATALGAVEAADVDGCP